MIKEQIKWLILCQLRCKALNLIKFMHLDETQHEIVILTQIVYNKKIMYLPKVQENTIVIFT